MITQQQIDETVKWDGLKEFGKFVLSHCEDGNLPDYKKMNLMKIPHLVPHIWVYDLRSPDKIQSLMVGFAGEKHTELHGKNVCGISDVDLFQGYEFASDIVEYYNKSINEKCVVYTKRTMEFKSDGDTKYRNIELLFFPCSSDGETVNWGIGCLTWEYSSLQKEVALHHF